jgi:hypothetical protein
MFSVPAFRIALANLRFPATPRESVALAEYAIAQAAARRARAQLWVRDAVGDRRCPTSGSK